MTLGQGACGGSGRCVAVLDVQQLPGELSGLIGEVSVLGEGVEALVAGGDVEADGVLELAQVNWAEVGQRCSGRASLSARWFEPFIRHEQNTQWAMRSRWAVSCASTLQDRRSSREAAAAPACPGRYRAKQADVEHIAQAGPVQAIRLLLDCPEHLPCVPLYRGDQPATGSQLLEQGCWRLLAGCGNADAVIRRKSRVTERAVTHRRPHKTAGNCAGRRSTPGARAAAAAAGPLRRRRRSHHATRAARIPPGAPSASLPVAALTTAGRCGPVRPPSPSAPGPARHRT